MPTPVEVAVQTYIAACSEREPVARAALFDDWLAEDVRMVTRSREVRGRAALVGYLSGFLDSPRLLRIRVPSGVDAQGTTFRYLAVADFIDGTSAASFEAGEIDARGQIGLFLTFAGELAESASLART